MKKMILLLTIFIMIHCSDDNNTTSSQQNTQGDTPSDTEQISQTKDTSAISDTEDSNTQDDPNFERMLIGKFQYKQCSTYSYTKFIVHYPDSNTSKNLNLTPMPTKGDTLIYPPIMQYSDTTLYHTMYYSTYGNYTPQYILLYNNNEIFTSISSYDDDDNMYKTFLDWYNLRDYKMDPNGDRYYTYTSISSTDSITYHNFNGWLNKDNDKISLHCKIRKNDGEWETDSILPYYIINKSNFEFLENNSTIDSIRFNGYVDTKMPTQDSLQALQIWTITYKDTTYTFNGGITDIDTTN